MAEQPIKVAFRFHQGVPFRMASDEDRKQSHEEFGQILKKWKSAGVKVTASFNVIGEGRDGYSHLVLMEFNDLNELHEMNRDLHNSRVLLERYYFEIGQPEKGVKDWWDSM